MTHFNGFISKKAIINSKLISSYAIIYGKSQIETNALIDPYVIIGYPVRSKTKEMISSSNEIIITESTYDRVSIGSTIGRDCHIRSFTTLYENSTLEDGVETGTNVIIREKCVVVSGTIVGIMYFLVLASDSQMINTL
jgi:UDP-3-O-[3-hydroxymyristoyl] glucosamine N-acyltransferase